MKTTNASRHRMIRGAWVAVVAIALGMIPVTAVAASNRGNGTGVGNGNGTGVGNGNDNGGNTAIRSNEVQNLSSQNTPAPSWSSDSQCADIDYSQNPGMDIYHFVVAPEIGGSAYKLEADFTDVSKPVVVEYADEGDSHELSAAYVGSKVGIQKNQIYVAVEKGKTLARAWLNYNVVLAAGSVDPLPLVLSSNHNLSHSCADPSTVTTESIPPEVILGEISDEYTIHYRDVYSWEINKDYLGFDPAMSLKYRVTTTRSGPTREYDGLSDATVTGSFTTNADQYVGDSTTKVEITYKGITEPCGVINLTFTCTLTDLILNDAQDGVDVPQYSVKVTMNAPTGDEDTDESDGTLTGVVDVEKINSSAQIDDDLGGYAAINVKCSGTTCESAFTAGSRLTTDPSESSVTLTYDIPWIPSEHSPTSCPTINNHAGLVVDGQTSGSPKLVSNPMLCLDKQASGLTIGYWGNKMGGPVVVKAQVTFRDASGWKEVLKAAIPSPFGDATAVRDYMTKATCSGYCQSMFVAQALASVMNALSNENFRNKSVLFQRQCRKVSELLTTALGSMSVYGDTSAGGTTLRIAYKSIFDDLNNNRATPCTTG